MFQADGVVQIAHGGLLGRSPEINYLVATVYPDRIDLELKEIAVAGAEGRSLPETIHVADAAKDRSLTSAGAAVLHRDSAGAVLSNATGCFQKAGLP